MATIYGYIGAAPAGGSSPHHVMIATPVGVNPCTDYLRSMVATVDTLARFGIRFDYRAIQGHCHVDDVRNMLMRDFLTTDCTDLFFIDADMGWKAMNFLRLLQVPGDIVAGVYPHKSDAFTYPFHPPRDQELKPNEHGLYEMPKVATGFMRIRRHVVEALYKREQDRGRCSRPGDELGDMLRSPLSVARIVERGFPKELGLEAEAGNDLYSSGDYVLCLKARQLGFKIFLDANMEFGHTGEKVWTGHFGNLYRQRNGLFQPEFCLAVDRLKSGNTEPLTFEALCHTYGVPDRNYIPWQMAPEALAETYRLAKEGAGPILELGSGLTTLVMGLALAGSDRAVHALEHDVHYWRRTAEMLAQFKIPNVILHYTPLLPEDDGTNRYAVEMADNLPEMFGLALLDGPPGKYGRAGVVSALHDRIKDAVLVIDDADREEDLLTLLKETTHDFQIKPGERWWAVAVPKERDEAPFAEAVTAIAGGAPTLEDFAKLNRNSFYRPASALPGRGLQACYDMAKHAQGAILECGSGVTTLVMGLALKGTPHKLYVLENNPEWVRRTGEWLRRHGVENVVMVYAPLVNDWYDIEQGQLPTSFDGVLVDGPGRVGAGRNGVFTMLAANIAKVRTIIVDDATDKFAFPGMEVEYLTDAAGDGAVAREHKIAIYRRVQAVKEAAE